MLPSNALSASVSNIDDEGARGSKLTTKEDSLILYESKDAPPDAQSFDGLLEQSQISPNTDGVNLIPESELQLKTKVRIKKGVKNTAGRNMKSYSTSFTKNVEINGKIGLPNIQTGQAIQFRKFKRSKDMSPVTDAPKEEGIVTRRS